MLRIDSVVHTVGRSPVCRCMKGFAPKNLQAWNLRDESDGWLRNTTLGCERDKFLQLKNMKLPLGRKIEN
jgi:hypothetical protein